MYKKGARIVHATHGIGIVKSVESKELLGQVLEVATVFFPEQELKLTINLSKQNLFRPLIQAKEAPKILEALRTAKGEAPSRATWRQRANLERLKSNDILQTVEVIKNLAMIRHTKKLNDRECAILEKTQRQLAQELASVSGRDFEEVLADIEKASITPPESRAS